MEKEINNQGLILKRVKECPQCTYIDIHPLVYCKICGTLLGTTLIGNEEFKARRKSYYTEQGRWATEYNFNVHTGEPQSSKLE